MKKQTFILFLLFVACQLAGFSQTSTRPASAPAGLKTYKYTEVKGDPLQARIYKLENGLTVYISVNKAEPRIQTCIPVKAGSKNDPADATGLAHYLEHMLFKGTDKFGSLDTEKEKPLLAKIEGLYEQYRSTTDEAKRKEIYSQIDQYSGEAAKFAIANEYDKMLSVIGATGTNAYTSFEQTVYINEIPSNMLEKWVIIEAERFRNPQFRLFHTELEAVYEEKNISLDRDGSAAWEKTFAKLFPTHNYGQQTTIGTVEHLKNPSIKKIRAYYEAYYVPNNMAICLSGDLDPDATIALIDAHFGYLKPQAVQPYLPAPEKPINGPITEEVSGPDAAFFNLAFRFPGIKSREAQLLTMVDMLLSNSIAGLMDLNLNQQQKVLSSGSFLMELNDYTVHMLTGRPNEGQTLEEVKDLILGQIELIKQGKFDEDMLGAIVDNLELDQTNGYESNYARASAFVDAFTSNRDWESYSARLSQLRTITKDEIVKFASKYYGKNYVVVYKRTGERNQQTHVEKPEITPVEVNREAKSDFLEAIISRNSPAIEPHFLDYGRDISHFQMSNGIPVHAVRNTENELFSLYYLFEMGSRHDKEMALAINYLTYLGTDSKSRDEIKKEFFKSGCEFNVFSSEDRIYVTLTGLNKNMTNGIQLFEDLLANCKPDQEALDKLVGRTLKRRADNKLNKNYILFQGMSNYGTYGPKNPFTDILSEAHLKKVRAEDLTKKLHQLTSYEHIVMYYGPEGQDKLVQILDAHHETPEKRLALPVVKPFVVQKVEEPTVYFVDYDMVQAEIMWTSPAFPYNAEMAPTIALYNEYYGGSMSSIVFQTIRESKALAYSTYSAFTTPNKPEDPHRIIAYVGTQADKINEAMEGMNELLNDMEHADNLFNASKEAILNKYTTERITRANILFSWLNAKRMGEKEDNRRLIFEKVPDLQFEDIKNFHSKNVANKNYNLLILGSKGKIDLELLKKYGKVKILTLEDVFGY